jgi:predicted ATPase/class 3 adenylate cyclase
MAELPTGTVTLLFTDIEGSTRLLEDLGRERYAEALARHREILRHAFAERGGYEVDYEGDAFFVSFPSATAAVGAAVAAQRALASEDWPDGGAVRVRVGLHTGEPLPVPPKYVGLDVHRAARIMAAGHGGQVLLSERTASLVEDELAQDLGLLDLGEHRLKDLSAPQRFYQLVITGLDADFPRLRTLHQTNLPVPATVFIGRERELGEVTELLSRDDVRLVTLTGPGGSGKTRLALQAAGGVADHFLDGIWWVPLAPLRDPALVLSSLAQALGIREQPGLPLDTQLRGKLFGKQLLLVLDNAEHLLPDIVSDISALRDIGGPFVIVTSRERLRLQGEHTYPVQALEQPDAAELFIARARQADPAFEPTETVDALCERLDRLPLALELAAARTVVFSPEQLLERLGQRLDLLRADRDVDQRQQTLRATIEWSHDLLSQPERELLRRLSVFIAGATYEAAERVAEADADTLQSLLDKSLLRRRDTDLGPRYWMLETIREFAAEKLEEAGETEDMRRRAAECILDFALEAEPGWRTGDMGSAKQFAHELDNVRAAIRFSLEDDPERALAIVAYLGWVWQVSGLLPEWLQWLETTRAKAKAPDPRLDGYAMLAHGLALIETGAAGPAEELIRASLPLLEEGGDPYIYVYGLNLIHEKFASDDPAEVNRLFDELDERTRELDNPVVRAMALNALSDRARDAGDRTAARALLEEACALNAHQPGHAVISLLALIALEIGDGDLEQARKVLARAAALAEADGFDRERAFLFIESAYIELLAGDAEAAAPHIAAAREIAERTEGWGLYGHLHYAEAAAYAAAGNDTAAAASWARAVELDPNPSESARLVETRLLEPLRARFDR